jgi:hypothetical protein
LNESFEIRQFHLEPRDVIAESEVIIGGGGLEVNPLGEIF